MAVLDYGIGNLRSAEKGLARVGADARLTDDPAVIADAAGVVLPGVGAFGRCMDALDRTGLSAVAHDVVARGVPFLAICIGMQLLYEESEENPGRTGLGILPGVVRRLPKGVKHPQMQWNVLELRRPSMLFVGMPEPAWFYFVHSYAPDDDDNATAVCEYGGEVVAAVERGNIWATQFHPEKSGANGLRLLSNFVGRCAE
ncbi:MAG: imidazole glycerol-phosphate synthase subunit HisH [Acidimicrobiaceae bacterium]